MTEQTKFEMLEAQLQFWAEIGVIDGGGIGKMEEVEESVPFPTRKEAENWLDAKGWVYDEKALRRVKEGTYYKIAGIREVKEFRFEKWIK